MRARVVVLLVAFSAAAWGQHSHGYFFFAPGALTVRGHSGSTIHLGGGGEAILGKGIGVSAELGALGPSRAFSQAIGAMSVNGAYHFVHERTARVDPFVTGGYSLFFREESANLFNFGGGANYWVGRRWGLKFEFRDHVQREPYFTGHYWGVRMGVVLRGGG